MNNELIADVFDRVADLLEFQGANAFRVRAYRSGARTIGELLEPVATMVTTDAGQLTKIAGIGKDLAAKCVALVETGTLPLLDELLAEIPSSVLDLLRIPGLGPKKAAVLYRELNITTLDEVQLACEQGRVRELKGFAAKTEQTILAGIEIAAAANQRTYWSKASVIAEALKDHLASCPSIEKLELAGSFRRGKETVGDLDFLAVSTDADEVMDRFAEYPEVKQVIGRGSTKMSVRLEQGLQVDLRIVPAESFGAALQYFTGSKEHNVVLRGLARRRGMKINEYGVYRVDGDEETYLAGRSEAEVYAAVDLPVFPPELRENRREFVWAEQHSLPELIELGDLRGDLHSHTTDTDGKATLEEMVEAARERGYQYLAITDHSQRVSMARGLTAERLLEQWSRVERLNDQQGDQFTLLKGIECDILEKGGMDLPDDVLAGADWVIASVHYGQNQSREKITERILGALANPHVDVVAHPTGRLINRRNPYEVDLEAVMSAASEYGKMLELNANPARLDLNDIHCAMAKQHGVPIVISSDAHKVAGLDVLQYGILQARRAGLTASDVANTRSWPEIKAMLSRH